MTALLLSDLAPYDLEALSAAIKEVLYWHKHRLYTREDRIAKDMAWIRLSQASAHLDRAIAFPKRGRKIVIAGLASFHPRIEVNRKRNRRGMYCRAKP